AAADAGARPALQQPRGARVLGGRREVDVELTRVTPLGPDRSFESIYLDSYTDLTELLLRLQRHLPPDCAGGGNCSRSTSGRPSRSASRRPAGAGRGRAARTSWVGGRGSRDPIQMI